MGRLKAAAMAVMAGAAIFAQPAGAASQTKIPIPTPRPEYPLKDGKQERIKCLAKAVYFEARGEPAAGQRMVAEVVLNRVQNPYYPKTVCEVVYQNDHMRNACQFSFACDGIPDTIADPEAYAKARAIAAEALSCEKCRVFRRLFRSSTHYHAERVRPAWADKLLRTGKMGSHIFYYTSTM